MKGRSLSVLALLFCVDLPALGQSPAGGLAPVDSRAEIAAALYAASATQAAMQRAADATIRAKQKEIEGLRAQIRAGDARAQAALTAAEEAYVEALAARDRTYAEEIAIFRAAVEDIAATPEGAAALARFNAGDEIGALAVLDDLRSARDAARRRRAEIESASEGRHNAMLALEARARGKLTTAQVISRYEEITTLDPGEAWDWVRLSRLYRDAGRLTDALRAARTAANTEDGELAAFIELGDVLVSQGDLPEALESYRASLGIAERLAASDSGNPQWQRALSVSHERVGDVLVSQGDLPGALESYRASLGITECLSTASDPGNVVWQRALLVSHGRIGSVLVSQGDLPGALESYRASLGIAERLAASDPSNTVWQKHLSDSHSLIGSVLKSQGDLPGAL
ncbi:MAG: hypothetical protein GY719_38965, partial [bacterium]|nr:hypothetical protein [bacterium]